MPETKQEKSPFELLNDRQKLFVFEYLQDFNATQAAIRAGYSEDTASVIACENLRKPNIKAAIDEKLKELWDSKEKELGRIWDEVRSIGYSKLGDFVEWNGEIASIKNFADLDTRAISSIKVKKLKSESKDDLDAEVVEIKLWDKLKALDSLAKMAGGMIEKHEIDIIDLEKTKDKLKKFFENGK